MTYFRRPTKYKARKTNGFGSALENAVHEMLLLRERAGEISDIRQQHTVVLQGGKRETRITWKIDFSFTVCATGELEFVEAKGFRTRDYVLKLKMFRANPQGALEIWGGTWRRPKLIERIEMKTNKEAV